MLDHAGTAFPSAVASRAGIPLLRLLQLSSATLPIGNYAYSHGLEQAATRGWVVDEATLGRWISGLIEYGLGTLDIPVLGRLATAWGSNDESTVQRWMGFCTACRESNELALEELRLGAALARSLVNLGVNRAVPYGDDPATTYLGMYALAVVEFGIEVEAAANAFLFAWAENQVVCATRLLPVGQLAAQRALTCALGVIPRTVERGLSLSDDDICTSAVGLGIASALHESQYCRLFRS
jgi:urease accessory protein